MPRTAEQHFTRVVRALVDAGMDAVAAVRFGPILDVTPDSDDDAVAVEVVSLQQTFPRMFASANPVPASVPSRPPSRQRIDRGTFGAKGLEEAKRRGWANEAEPKPEPDPAADGARRFAEAQRRSAYGAVLSHDEYHSGASR